MCCACALLAPFDELAIHIQPLLAEEKEDFYNWSISSFLSSEKGRSN